MATPLSEFSNIDRPESINILLVSDSGGDGMLGEVLRKWQLN
jgi:hypothetical protein